MTTLVLRNTKGSPLTFTELDNNFSNLNTDKLDVASDNYVTTTTSGTVCTFSNVDAYPGRFEVTAASTGGWEAGAGHLQVEYNFTTSGYFSAIVSSGSGHMGCALRVDSSVIGSHIRGHGHLIGLCSNGITQSTDVIIPNAMLETWMGGLGASQGNIVYPGSELPPGYKFEDGKNYKVILDSVVDHNDRKWLRTRYYVKEGSWITDTIDGTAGFWTMLWDTGYWLDTNPWADFTKTGIWFYEVFTPAGTWSITFSDLKVRWGPYLGQAEEATANRHYRNGTNMTWGLFPRSDAYGPTGMPGTFRMSGFDNSSMLNYANTYPNFDWAEWCDVNDIKNKISGTLGSTTAGQIENVLRPLYCIVGTLCKAAKDRGW